MIVVFPTMTAEPHSTIVSSTSPVNLNFILEVEMDHYSLELLAKLHHKQLVLEGLHGQSVSRLGPGKHRSSRWKVILFVAATIVLTYFGLFL
jgi:hypothetical protein